MTNDEIAALLKTMRDGGVDEFELNGFKVKFDPTLRSARNEAPDFTALEKEQAMQRFGAINKDDDSLLDWSV